MRSSDDKRKIRSAVRLFDTIGMIDDRIIADAEYQSPCTRERKTPFLRRYAVSLAALLLVVVMVGGFAIANLSGVIDSDTLNESMEDDAGHTELTRKPLEFVLSGAAENTNAETLSLDEIDFFDGELSLIWSYEGDEYHKLSLRVADESEIKNCMSKSVEQIPLDNADETICMVWVSYGNGEVVSPYLKESAGNVGYATLFEYSPEVVPSDSFCDLVNEALRG